MPAPAEIAALVSRFDEQYDSYRAPAYNETQLRREFVDPFFRALGWDVDNRQGWAEIDATDREIDRLVHELYVLTDDEIRIVEEATGGAKS